MRLSWSSILRGCRRAALHGAASAVATIGLLGTVPTPAQARPEPTAKARSHAATPAARPRAETRSAQPRRAAPRRAEALRRTEASRQAARPARSPAPRRAAAPTDIGAILADAAAAHGVDVATLAALAWRESRFDPRARNPQSTARGLMQFTEDAWLEAVRDHGRAHGLAREAARLTTDPQTGAISAPTARERERLLARRHEPRLAAALAAARVAQARPVLQAALGRPVGPADLYAAHMLGVAGARRFLGELAARPERAATEVVGAEAVARNRSVFVRSGGGTYTLREVHAAMAASVTEGQEALAARAPGMRVLVLAAN